MSGNVLCLPVEGGRVTGNARKEAQCELGCPIATTEMAKQRFKPEEIILELREVEIRQGKGLDKVVGVFPK